MKKMKCNQLGGPENCEVEFEAETWEEMKEKSMNHGREMFEKNDDEHLKAGKEMKEKMQNPEEMNIWMEEKKKAFEALAEEGDK